MGIFRRLTTQTGAELIPFSFTIQVGNNQSFTLPINDYQGDTPYFTVLWGDGNSSIVRSSSSSDKTHIYTNAGTYTIEIYGSMPSFKVDNNSSIRNLITSIVHFGNVGLKEINFWGCSNISSIPASGTMEQIGYGGLSDVINFSAFMRETGLTSIPSDIFSLSVNATNFTNSFALLTGLTTVPVDLFSNNVNVINFASTFLGCTSLTNGGGYSTLFDNCPDVTSFSSTFRNCLSLASAYSFTNNTSVTNFLSVYEMSSTTNAMDGNAPPIWTRTPVPVGTKAFFNCLGLDNYADIPSNFK